ncbi:phosphohistidine phosphatase SixA [Nitrosarchaeum sp.]|nr:phosphohistidine phosphatase SixA [Nitrosarchaeum sp.]
MELYIIRHGKAEEISISSDAKRRLTKTGIQELEYISKALKNFDIQVDYVFSSPLIRAKETAEIVAKQLLVKKKKIITWDELKPESDVLDIHKKFLKLSPDAKILLVGHEPHLTNLISSIISQCNVTMSLKKGGFVSMSITSSKSRITGTLRSILTPKQLKLCK